jgi:hypothetical protein
LEVKQRELDQMVQKMQLPVDIDIVRMKIQKELEGKHRIDLEQKVHQNERLQDQYYESKRQLDIARSQLESVKFEAEKELNDVKARFRTEVQELMLQN